MVRKKIHGFSSVGYQDWEDTYLQSIVQFKQKFGKDEWVRRIYKLLCFYGDLRQKRSQKGFSPLRQQAAVEISKRSNFKQIEKLYVRFLNEIDPTGLSIQDYMRWCFEYAGMFFKQTNHPYIPQMYSDKLFRVYRIYRSNCRVKGCTTISVIDKQATMESYRKALEPVWGEDWKHAAHILDALDDAS